MSHGSRYHRRPGSMYSCSEPCIQRQKLAGRMGGDQVTIKT